MTPRSPCPLWSVLKPETSAKEPSNHDEKNEDMPTVHCCALLRSSIRDYRINCWLQKKLIGNWKRIKRFPLAGKHRAFDDMYFRQLHSGFGKSKKHGHIKIENLVLRFILKYRARPLLFMYFCNIPIMHLSLPSVLFC